MPWNEISVMDERIKFIGRFLSGEKMAVNYGGHYGGQVGHYGGQVFNLDI